MSAATDVDTLKQLLVTGTRVLHDNGLVDAFGHLSVRQPGTDRFLINPRQSPAFLRPDTVLTMTLDGDVVEGTLTPNSEWHIHASIYRARSDVQSVVHAHTEMSIIFSMSPAGLRPIFGNTTAQFGAEPLPVYPHPGLITEREKGDRLARMLGDRTAVLLRGHGCAVTGDHIQHTVIRLLEMERNGRFLQAILAQNQGEPRYWTPEEVEAWGTKQFATVAVERYWEYLVNRPGR